MLSKCLAVRYLARDKSLEEHKRQVCILLCLLHPLPLPSCLHHIMPVQLSPFSFFPCLVEAENEVIHQWHYSTLARQRRQSKPGNRYNNERYWTIISTTNRYCRPPMVELWNDVREYIMFVWSARYENKEKTGRERRALSPTGWASYHKNAEYGHYKDCKVEG